MNPHQLKRLFPNASASVLAANAGDYGSGQPQDSPVCSPVNAPESFSPPNRPDAAEQGAQTAGGALNAKDENYDHHIDPGLPNPKHGQRKKALASRSKGKTQSAGCPLVRYTLRRVKLLDVDAKYASVKDTLDGLRIAGLIHGDKEGEITLEVVQERVAHYEDEATEITICYPDL